MGKIKTWYKSQAIWVQLLIVFLWNVFFWFIISILGQLVFDEFNKSFVEKLTYALFMGLGWTLFFDWKLVKKALSNKGQIVNKDDNE